MFAFMKLSLKLCLVLHNFSLFFTIFFYCVKIVLRSPRIIIALSSVSKSCSDFFCGNADFKCFNYIDGSQICPLINKLTWQCSLLLLNGAICSPKMSAAQKLLWMPVIWTDCNVVWLCFWGVWSRFWGI